MLFQESPCFRIASAIPGRVRIQLQGPCGRSERLQPLAARLTTLASVLKVEVVAGASSIVVRYAAAQQALPTLLRAIEAIAVTVLTPEAPHVRRPRRDSLPTQARPGPRASQAGAAVVHSFPGRLRLRVPLLGRVQVATQIEKALGLERGIRSVEMSSRQPFLIIRYETDVYDPARIVTLVERLLRAAVQAPSIPAEIARARDLPTKPGPVWKPLLFPSIAVALAFTGAAPAAVTRGALALAALPLVQRALEGVRARRFNVDQLDLTALLVLAGRGDFLIGSLMTWLIGLGDIIRAKTMGRARREVSSLMSPTKQHAWVEQESGQIVSTAVSQLQSGDTVLVYPGDQVPADGVVTKGRALVDQKILTGESVPIVKEVGDAVFALTLVAEGQISVRVEHIGKATRAGQVAQMIEDAPLSDTRIQDYAARIGDRLVGPIFGLALATYLLGGDSLRVAGVLILDFASGIRVSAPTTILSAMTGAAKQGLFIKGGRALENLARVNAVVFDKTGTLTRGEPVITAVHALDPAQTPDDVLRLAASAEANLKHPAAKAIVDAATARGLEITPPTQMDYVMGLGMQAVIAERTVHVGSERYLNQAGIDTAPALAMTAENAANANSLVYVSLDKKLIGFLAYADPPRAESAAVVRMLRQRGIKRILMVTGDNAYVAQAVATEVGITNIVADAFPEQKARIVQRLRRQGHTVAVIGDGINDSPAFMRADVGISLPHGADVAREVADVILLDGDLRGLPRAIDVSRHAMRVLRQNVNIVVWPTAMGIAASLVGRATPLLSTLISHGTTIIAGLNGLRPLFPKVSRTVSTPRPSRVQQATGAAAPEGDLRALVWPILRRLPAYLRLGWALMKEPAIPWRHKTLLYIFPIYYVSPAHLLLHPIPVLGQIDGALFLVLALRQALRHCPLEALTQHLSRLNLAPTQLDDDCRTALQVVRRLAGSVRVARKLRPSMSPPASPAPAGCP